MKKSVLIVAGGKGLRMGGEIPKQFLTIGGKPVLIRTVEAFYRYESSLDIILVLPREQQEYWSHICRKYSFDIPCKIADGGETRFHSVKNGLELVEDGLVGVHDGVRPFVALDVIARCFDMAEEEHAVVPVIEMIETVRHLCNDGKSVTVNRDDYKLVQTPQVFSVSLLKRAYSQPYSPLFTDDASVVEALGETICLVEGNRENIKLTTPFDLKIVNALL